MSPWSNSAGHINEYRDWSEVRRAVYALTAAKVAGAVAQTNIYDYRRGDTPSNKHSHFGVPLSCLVLKLRDTPSHKNTDERFAGEIFVSGASVAGGETALGVNGK